MVLRTYPPLWMLSRRERAARFSPLKQYQPLQNAFVETCHLTHSGFILDIAGFGIAVVNSFPKLGVHLQDTLSDDYF